MPAPRKKKGRPRDAAATRAAIVAAARALFTRHGYGDCSLRRIAARAGVNVALVARYFGSKKGLFAAILAEALLLEPLLEGGKAGFPGRLAREMAEKSPADPDHFDPLLMILRAASHPEAGVVVRETLEARLERPFAAWLGGDDAALRGSLLFAWLCGLGVARSILRQPVLLKAPPEKLARELAKAFRATLREGD